MHDGNVPRTIDSVKNVAFTVAVPMTAESRLEQLKSRSSQLWEFIVECRANDPDVARQGRILAGILALVSSMAFVTFIIFTLQSGSILGNSIDFVCGLLVLSAFFDNRRGNVQRSGLIAVAFLLLAMNAFPLFVSTDLTSRTALALLWIFPILVANAVLSWQIVLSLTLFCGLNVAILHVYFFRGLPPVGGIPWSVRLTQSVIVIMSAGILSTVSRYQTDRYQRELRERNADLDRANNELESEVRNRTQDLVEARDLALAASRVKSEILLNMSHEMHTPLHAILGNADLLLDTPLETRQHEFANDMRTSGNGLLALISDMLEYSSLDLGGTKLEERPFELRQSIANAIALLMPTAIAKELDVATHIAADVPKVILGDAARLRRVLVNLVSNAIKFTEKGTVAIYVELSERQDEQLVLRFRVRDTGIGISAENFSKIFEAFGRVDASLTRRTSGAGLGLALSKRLVELMGGQLTLESRVGEGSTFTFDVHARLSNEGALAAQEDKPAPKSTPPHSRKNPQTVEKAPIQILLVEDNAVNQRVALAMLKKLGYQADLAENGLQAVHAVEKKPYDVILMDVQMPEMDGLEATRTILARTDLPRRPRIIGFTAHTLAADKEECYAAGMIDIVAKPTELPRLDEALSRAVARAA